MDRLLALDLELMGQAIRRSCEIKAGIVSRDEKEQAIRALLNFGHTFRSCDRDGVWAMVPGCTARPLVLAW